MTNDIHVSREKECFVQLAASEVLAGWIPPSVTVAVAKLIAFSVSALDAGFANFHRREYVFFRGLG